MDLKATRLLETQELDLFTFFHIMFLSHSIVQVEFLHL
jgi:hypothetical protein